MMKNALGAIGAVLLLVGCDVTTLEAPVPGQGTDPAAQGTPSSTTFNANQAARSFIRVVNTVEPVAERECRQRTSGINCDFNIVVDDRPGQPANAFQTLDRSGRPVVAFTLALIADARNEDELAFVLGHEAAHHIERHIGRQQENAVAGAVIAAAGAVLIGADTAGIQRAQEYGAQLGARSYSKEFELEADALGTVITARAGYKPLVGAQFFARIPDPGDKFLGTHPPNAARLDVVRQTVARMNLN